MLKTECINPDIMSALSECGHKDKIVIGSGNFPMLTRSNPEAVLVNLALKPMLPTSTDILEAIAAVIPVESATVLRLPDVKGEVEAHEEYKKVLGLDLDIIDNPSELYEIAATPEVRLVVESADMRAFSNIILTVGCRRP